MSYFKILQRKTDANAKRKPLLQAHRIQQSRSQGRREKDMLETSRPSRGFVSYPFLIIWFIHPNYCSLLCTTDLGQFSKQQSFSWFILFPTIEGTSLEMGIFDLYNASHGIVVKGGEVLI